MVYLRLFGVVHFNQPIIFMLPSSIHDRRPITLYINNINSYQSPVFKQRNQYEIVVLLQQADNRQINVELCTMFYII